MAIFSAPRRGRRQRTRRHPLHQAAFKPAALRGPVGVDPAKSAIEVGARLRKRQLAGPFFHQGQAGFSQPSRVIARAQFHIGEQRAVAAQAAART
jgi:hypothetical protein